MKLFIHIPKNGGSTIVREPESSAVCFQPDRSMLSSRYLIESGITRAWGHCRWKDLDTNIRSKYQAFTIVRNPWSWMVSQYMYRVKLKTDTKRSFHEFIELMDKRRYDPVASHAIWHKTTGNYSLQKNYTLNEAGKRVVDILRFESYNEDTMKYLGLKNPLKPHNVTNVDKKDYREFYDEYTNWWIEDNFAEDIEYFGFTFDGGATKNIWNTGD